jgi:cyclic beta-1,2-glucan synthetase
MPPTRPARPGIQPVRARSHGIALDLLQYVPPDDPIKISRLKIRNISARTRRLSVTAYVEWVLGTSRERSAPFIVTEIDPETGALFARNPWNSRVRRARRLRRSRRTPT